MADAYPCSDARSIALERKHTDGFDGIAHEVGHLMRNPFTRCIRVRTMRLPRVSRGWQDAD